MKAKYISLLMLLSSFFACNQTPECDEVIPDSPLINKWELVQVDSGYIAAYPNAQYKPRDTLAYTGSFSFYSNNQGRIEGSISSITCLYSDFLWLYQDTIKTIRFLIGSGCTEGLVKELSVDTLAFLFEDFCKNGHRVGATLYYNLLFVKSKN